MPPTTRTYLTTESCVFRSTRARFGGLSNMAAGFPLTVGHAQLRNSEALYQACRFPMHPDVQQAILLEGSPMSAKMVARRNIERTRPDWDRRRVHVMRWCLAVKLAQNFDMFGRLLESTGERQIVEESRRDDFWGAKPAGDGMLVGRNALGRLLMELRASYSSPRRYAMLRVPVPSIPHFVLLDEPIPSLDERERFVAWIRQLDTQLPAAASSQRRLL